MNLQADLNDCILSVGDDAEVIRHLPAPVVKGRVQGRPEEKRFPITISLQPMTQKQLNFLPEGMRNSGAMRGFTSFNLLTTDTSDCSVPDRIIKAGVTYQVQRVDDWSNEAGYYEILATRIGQ